MSLFDSCNLFFVLKDFAEEKDNLVFLNVTAKDQANLLLEAISVNAKLLT